MNAITNTDCPQIAAKARLKWDAVRGRHMLLFPEGVLMLNETAHEVLALCDGRRTVADIAASLGEKYKSGPLDGDVREILQRLMEKSLVRIND